MESSNQWRRGASIPVVQEWSRETKRSNRFSSSDTREKNSISYIPLDTITTVPEEYQEFISSLLRRYRPCDFSDHNVVEFPSIHLSIHNVENRLDTDKFLDNSIDIELEKRRKLITIRKAELLSERYQQLIENGVQLICLQEVNYEFFATICKKIPNVYISFVEIEDKSNQGGYMTISTTPIDKSYGLVERYTRKHDIHKQGKIGEKINSQILKLGDRYVVNVHLPKGYVAESFRIIIASLPSDARKVTFCGDFNMSYQDVKVILEEYSFRLPYEIKTTGVDHCFSVVR